MKLKKLLSLFVCTLLVVSTLGVFSVSAATTVDKTINIPVGSTYSLPAEIDGAAVTWDKTVDTSKFGYRLYTGTTESGTVTYRVNVGEYVTTMFDDLESHSTAADGTHTLVNTNLGGKLYIPPYLEGGYTENTSKAANRIVVEENGNNVLSFGKENTGWNHYWQPSSAATGNIRMSFDVKIASFNLAYNQSSAASVLFEARFNNSGKTLFQFRASNLYDNTNKKIGLSAVRLRPYGYADGTTDTQGSELDRISMVKDKDYTIDENNVMHSTKWIPIVFEFKETGTYDIYVDGEKQATDLGMASAWTNTLTKFVVAKRNTKSVTDAETYFDNFKIEQCVYFDDELTEINDVAISDREIGKEQTLDYDLTMSNGATKTIQVKYTPEAGKTSAVGEIEGFDNVTVNYKLLAEKDETINTIAGKTVELADGSTITPETIGILKKTVSTENEIINYTINVSGYVVKYSDDLQNHTKTTWAQDSLSWETIKPGTANGLTLTMANNNNGNRSAVLVNDGDNQYAKMQYKTADGNMKWYVDEDVSGKYSVTARMKAENFTNGSGGIGNYFKLMDTKTKPITHAIALRSYMGKSSPYMQIRQVQDAGSAAVYTGTTLSESTHKITYTDTGIDWFTLRIDVDTEKRTYALYVNDVEIFKDAAFSSTDANGILDYIDYDARNSQNDGYIDDVQVLVLDSFDGNIPSINTVAGMGAADEVSSKIELSTVGGLKFYPTATFAVDTSKVGNKTAVATVEGFTDPVTVNVKVCNYDASYDAEKVTLTNISGIAGATAIIAYYGTGDVFIKADDLVAVAAAKGAAQAIPYNAPEGAVKVKVFIINNATSVQPIDLVTEIPLA